MTRAWGSRISTVALLFLLRAYLPSGRYEYVLLSAILGHYALALVYSWEKIRLQARTPLGAASLSVFSLLAYPMARFQLPSTPVLLSVHHTFTEVYTSGPRGKCTSFTRNLFNWLVYVSLLIQMAAFSWIPADLLFSALVTAYLATLYSLVRANLPARQVCSVILYDSFALAAVILIPPGYATFEEVSFYHIAYWGFFALPAVAKAPGGLARYAGITGLVTFGIWLLTPDANLVAGGLASWIYWSRFFGSLHIVTTVPLTRWQPRWLTRWVDYAEPHAPLSAGAPAG